ncbi:MAG: arginyltransferase [Duodenibacillus sp.]|nr:arginyltransferase [Duodenibacillus sp.]
MPEVRLTAGVYLMRGPCPYFEGRAAVSEIIVPRECPQELFYSLMAPRGLRRDADYVYRPACPGCARCIPSRIDLEAFRPDRTMRKVLRRAVGVRMRLLPPDFSEEHYELFARYERMRHGGHMAEMTAGDYSKSMLESRVATRLLEVREEDRLVGVCVIDFVHDGLSAVYNFYEPGLARRSPGTLLILGEISVARHMRQRYLYLGHWIPGYPRMDYKRRFSGFEVLFGGAWQPLAACEDALPRMPEDGPAQPGDAPAEAGEDQG